MENDKLTSGEESLAIIHAMINKAKHQFSDNGHLYLLWGWVVLLCSITQFLIINFFYFKIITFTQQIVNEDYIINSNNKINLQYFKLHYLLKMNKN